MDRREPAQPETEPWMRGTHSELDALRRALVHALELAGEDIERWCAPLSDEQMFAGPAGLPSVAFHLRHIVRSLDRLLTYAEDHALGEEQLASLKTERDPGTAAAVLYEYRRGLQRALERAVSFVPSNYEQPRGIGRLRLPTTVGGLLVHCADHTSRHVGQAVTTAKLLQYFR